MNSWHGWSQRGSKSMYKRVIFSDTTKLQDNTAWGHSSNNCLCSLYSTEGINYEFLGLIHCYWSKNNIAHLWLVPVHIWKTDWKEALSLTFCLSLRMIYNGNSFPFAGLKGYLYFSYFLKWNCSEHYCGKCIQAKLNFRNKATLLLVQR